MRSLLNIVLLAAAAIGLSQAFVVPSSTRCIVPAAVTSSSPTTSTQMNGRKWNFNEEGRSPWGLKNNAEVWNGRVAQMGFTVVLLQELITGKGVVAGIQDGDALSLALLGITASSVVGLTVWLAIQGTEQFVDIEKLRAED